MARQENFLPPGLALKKVIRHTRWTDPIAQARLDGPIFRVKVDYLPYRGFREAVLEAARLRQQSGGSDPEQTEMTALRPMLEKAVPGWEGATILNINQVLRSDRVIRPSEDTPEALEEFNERYIVKQEEIPFNIGFFTYVWFNSYPERFQNPVFKVLQEWTDDVAAEVKLGNDD